MSSVVCVVGSSSIDLFVRAARLPNTGETVLGSSFAKAFGGKGANQAVQCAILGTRVVFVGRVGNTSEGRDIVNNFESRGIDVSHVNTSDTVPAGVALIEVDEISGANRIIVVPGANGLVRPADLQDALLQQCSFLVLQLEIPLQCTLDALQRGHSYRVRTVLNPSPVPEAGAPMQQLIAALPHVSFLVLNEFEAEHLSQIRVVDVFSASGACAKLLSMGVSCVILTMGEAGAVFQSANEDNATHVKSPEVERVVDTTGAGDSFLGAFVHFHSGGASIALAVERACAVASLSVQREGCQPSYADASTVARIFPL